MIAHMQVSEENSAANQPSLSASAYDYLLARLRSGLLGASDKLVEADIANQLGVSRVPVRQALLQLVAEGYLVSTPRGYKVPTLTPQDVEDVFELRLLLEPRAAALAARDITAEQLQRVDLAVSEAQRAHDMNDASGAFSAGRHFRDAWLAAVRNKRLASGIARYADQVALVRRMTLGNFERRLAVIAGYRDLRSAFARHDSITAHDAMLRLVLGAQRDFAELVQNSS
ncbi:DNA-binding GntR family transcriptional regulator [Variovorax sp. SG517]|uniref:GntR family transcriptional regulator n=1 Tax=Variovorax sp. SG517 TaxID=2587117 RepID=UPI00159E6BEA|nr:GntR family transcriptional regulator [Variovorax sp. SG517]NVM90219.1 DNA-binding GntR family transcriptional regulator [Variovorax sp. SG517]